jgi:hypothetical protein
MELVGIKVKIGLKDDGKAKYPDWSQTSFRMNNPNYKIGKYGGWHYDKCGHTKRSDDSPLGVQYGMLLVEQEFADEAIVLFPDLITKMTKAEVESFWDDKAHGHISENKYDTETLTGLKAEYDIKVILEQDTTDVKEKMRRAIDPDDKEPGVLRNRNKKFKTAMADADIIIIDAR